MLSFLQVQVARELTAMELENRKNDKTFIGQGEPVQVIPPDNEPQ